MGDLKEGMAELAAELKLHTPKKMKPRYLGGAGSYCAAVDCHNNQRRDVPRGIHFYRDAIQCCHDFQHLDGIFKPHEYLVIHFF